MTNGAPETSLQHHGPKVYGIVQRVGSDRQQEVMAREWTVSHLQDEMKYIREVSGNKHKQAARPSGQHIIVLTSRVCKAVWDVM